MEEAGIEFQVALEGMPNDAALWTMIGSTQRRLGSWAEALAASQRVIELDPLNADGYGDLAQTLRITRRYEEAAEQFGRAMEIAPDVAQPDLRRGWIWMAWRGRLDSLSAALDRHPPDIALGAWGSARRWRALALHWERKPDSLLGLLRQSPEPFFESKDFLLPMALYSAWAHQLRGDAKPAQVAFDSALVRLDSALVELPDDWRIHAARGLALAGLGMRQEAEAEARWLRQSPIYGGDALDGVILAENRAMILTGIGEWNAALDEIEQLLEAPSWVSAHTFRLDPGWDPIRQHPRFQALLEKYAVPGPAG